jgi:hypothetical protein
MSVYVLFFPCLFQIFSAIAQPTHDGMMVQLGWNAGPRHAHVWGLAKSYMKNLGEETKAEHDKDAVALMSLCWNIAKATLPVEVTRHIEKLLAEHSLPHIAAHGALEGLGAFLLLYIYITEPYNISYRERLPF